MIFYKIFTSVERVVKLIALEFVNNFLSLFYVAFWLQDIQLIRSQLMTQLLVFQVCPIILFY